MVITFVAFASLLSPAGLGNSSPIDDLIHSLAPGGLWMNGLSPFVVLPKRASPQLIFEEAANQTIFESGEMKTYRIIETRKVTMDPPVGSNLSAILVATNLGSKILLYFPEQFKTKPDGVNYWTRFYDVKPGWTAPDSPSDPSMEALIGKLPDTNVALRDVYLQENAAPELVFKAVVEKEYLMPMGKHLVQIKYFRKSQTDKLPGTKFVDTAVFDSSGHPFVVRFGPTGENAWKYSIQPAKP